MFNSNSITAGQALVSAQQSLSSGFAGRAVLFAAGDIANDPVGVNTFGATSSGTQANTTTGYTANQWYSAAAVFNSVQNYSSYINGGSVANGTSTTVPNFSIGGVTIGARWNGSNFGVYASGQIAEVGIWNAALTAAEIASLAKGMTCDKIRPQSLVFYAPLVRDLIDAKGGRSITNNNGATVATHPRVYA